jgi:hypothetical protein
VDVNGLERLRHQEIISQMSEPSSDLHSGVDFQMQFAKCPFESFFVICIRLPSNRHYALNSQSESKWKLYRRKKCGGIAKAKFRVSYGANLYPPLQFNRPGEHSWRYFFGLRQWLAIARRLLVILFHTRNDAPRTTCSVQSQASCLWAGN